MEPITRKQRADVLRMWRKGLTTPEMARHTTVHTIISTLKLYGLRAHPCLNLTDEYVRKAAAHLMRGTPDRTIQFRCRMTPAMLSYVRRHFDQIVPLAPEPKDPYRFFRPKRYLTPAMRESDPLSGLDSPEP